MARRLHKSLYFGCTHSPLHDKGFVEFLCDQIAQERPHTVACLGDFLEADSASRWPSEATWTLEEEFESADELLGSVQKAAPRTAELILTPGNHDDNLLAVNRLDKRLRGMADWRSPRVQKTYLPALMAWKIPAIYEFSPRGVYQDGPITVGHGWQAGKYADRKHAEVLAKPDGLWVGAHTHRPTPVTQHLVRKPTKAYYVYHANVGTGREILDTPEYMKRKDRSQWGQAIVVAEYLEGGTGFSAELRVYRMFADYFKKDDT